MHVRVWICMCVCVRACVRACVCACVRACVPVCVCTCVRAYLLPVCVLNGFQMMTAYVSKVVYLYIN